VSSEQRLGGTGLTGPAAALRRCIGIEPAEFAERVWGQALLLSPAARTGADFSDLLSVEAVDELISRRGLRTPFVRMAKTGSVLPTSRFTRAGGAGASIGDQVADDKVLNLFLDGATLVLQALHRTWPPLVEFGAALSSELSHPVQINAYVTPPQNQGFAAHYDTHDVFVLQVHGTKRWVIHEPVVRWPLPEQNWEKHRDQVSRAAAGDPALDVVLAPGDALYLPRGYLHSATALGEAAIHLTVGVHPLTEFDLLRELLASLTSQSELRASLPIGADLGDSAVLAPLLSRAAGALAGFASSPDAELGRAVADRISAKLAASTRPSPISPLAQAETLRTLDLQDQLTLRPGLRVRLEHRAETVSARFLDTDLSLAATTAKALELVLTGARFTPAELTGLDAAEQLELARTLVRAAMIVPADVGRAR
jgi:lysine-specific demethylase/histidyl-hydroxylase NO66